VVDIRLDEAVLLLGRRVQRRVAGVGAGRVVVVVGPLGEVVCEFQPRRVGGGVLEVDDDELLVLVGGLEERGFLVVWADAEDVAVLCLRSDIIRWGQM
jgi:hypothetical protein